MTYFQISEILSLWSEGLNTFDIAKIVGLPEHVVEEAVYAEIVRKRRFAA